MLEIKFKKLNPLAKVPLRMTAHAAGYDIYSANEKPIIVPPNKVTLIPTGIAISLPNGYEAQIRPRSGLALKHQIGVLNSPGTIDADYRGEIKIILFNFGTENFTITSQTRIAQMVISKHEIAEFVLTETLDATSRNDGGFGHTEH